MIRTDTPRRGPPKGSCNAIKNGSRELARLNLGDLPTKWRRVKTYARQYRRDLEDAVMSRHGEVSVADAHLIHAAASWAAHAGICRWLLCNRSDTMTTMDITKCSAEIAMASERRNKLVKQLGIDPPAGSTMMAMLYERDQPDAPDASETSADAPAASESQEPVSARQTASSEPSKEATPSGINSSLGKPHVADDLPGSGDLDDSNHQKPLASVLDALEDHYRA
jgi:hypothetical protein